MSTAAMTRRVATVLNAPPRPNRAVSGESWGLVPLVYFCDFMLGLCLMWDRAPIPGVGQPVGVALLAVAASLAWFRKPVLRNRKFWELLAIYGAMLIFVVAVTEWSGLSWQQRSAKMVLLLIFALCIASGRISPRHLLLGFVVGLLVNAVLFYAGLTPNQYPPFLTGFLGDKNIAGLVYGVAAVAGLTLYRRRRLQLVHLAVFGWLVVLTGSRTSLAGVVVALIWIGLRNRLWLGLRIALIGALMWGLTQFEERFARVGPFADRAGTDWFREQIGLATENKLAVSPWFGNGLTTAWVNLSNGRFMYFHDSYAALRVEGGWPMVIAMLVIVVIYGGGIFRVKPVGSSLLYMEGAVAIVLVCAWKLGEVFFTTPAFLVLGLLWALRFGELRDSDSKDFFAPRRSRSSA